MNPGANCHLAASPAAIGRMGPSGPYRKPSGRRGEKLPASGACRTGFLLAFPMAAPAIIAGRDARGDDERPSLEEAVRRTPWIGMSGERLHEETSAGLA